MNVFVRDRETVQTICITCAPSRPSVAGGGVHGPVFSPDGRYIAFRSRSQPMISIYDLMSDSYLPSDNVYSGIYSSPSLSLEARFVAFESYVERPLSALEEWQEKNFPTLFNPSNLTDAILVYDRKMGSVTRIYPLKLTPETSGDANYPSISSDGRYVTFDAGGIFLYDMDTGNTILVSVPSVSD